MIVINIDMVTHDMVFIAAFLILLENLQWIKLHWIGFVIGNSTKLPKYFWNENWLGIQFTFGLMEWAILIQKNKIKSKLNWI
jgi:hypothetical protein